jgi:hypothetical protein
MPHPQVVPFVKVGMAERYEVVIDFADYQLGQRVVMQNISPENNIDFDTTGVVMAFDVVAEASDLSNNEIPANLNDNPGTMGLTEADAVRTRVMEFKRDGGQWTINGETWDDVINSGFTRVVANPGFGDVEIWELVNKSNGWFHPVHIHLVDFKILDRNGRPPFAYEVGPKDVAYVGEGEVVRVIMRFEHEEGRYMMHCHNLVHEDHDMMVQFLVGGDAPGQDPITADRAARKPARPLRNRHDDPDEPSGGGGGGGDDGGGNSGHGGDGGGGGDGGRGGGDGGRNSGSSGTASSVKRCAPAKKTTKKPVLKKRKKALQARSAATKTKPKPKPKPAAKCVTPSKKRKPVAKRKRKPTAPRKPVKRSGGR